jgi:multiple sugar transport system substrate-binding protein
MEPESRAGLRSYFRLGRHLAPETRSLNGLEPDHLFINDPRTAMTISGPWLADAPSPAGGPIAAALPPGPPFVGGSYLVVWKYSRMAEAAVQLVRYLTRTPIQVSYARHVGLLPARLEALAVEPFSNDPFWQTAVAGLKSGRTFPTIPLWGLVEDRLTSELGNLWADCLADPELNLDAAIGARLGPLARRLDALLR